MKDPRISDRRIVHVPRRFAQDDWGGTESVVHHLCRSQQQAGWIPEIHTTRALNRTGQETWQGIPVRRYRYCYPFLGLSREKRAALDRKGGNLLSLDLFAHLLAIRNPRIFHAHAIKRLGGEVLSAARIRRRPCVVTLHGNVFDVPEAEGESMVEAQQGHLEWGRPFGLLFGSRDLLERADAVICVGHSEFKKAKQNLNHDRVHYLPNGVDPDAFPSGGREEFRARHGFGTDAFVFGCISRIDRQKDQGTLLEAFGRITNDHPQARLLLAGPVTQPDYRDALQQHVRESGLREKVRILPPVAPGSADHAACFSALDAFVLPSRHEPFGIVVLEAWAAGKPVIASTAGGLAHLVTDRENGLTFTPGDAEALAHLMGSLAKEPQLAGDLAEKGRRLAVSDYSWSRMAERQEEIFRRAEFRCGRRGKADLPVRSQPELS